MIRYTTIQIYCTLYESMLTYLLITVYRVNLVQSVSQQGLGPSDVISQTAELYRPYT